ncbi:MAG: prepilin peptidase, partial [Candidatus Omnitrophica bacterium]|nr:prepilin peptidase [Candidatus Omnitrophota bacterium]
LGSFLGWQKVLLIFFLAPFFGAGVGIVAKFKYKIDTIPYGPYLSLAAVVVILFGEEILNTIFFL